MGGIWSVQEVKIREGSGKALNMNKWFACRAWLWMTPDQQDCKDATKSTQVQIRVGDLGTFQVWMTDPASLQLPSLWVSMAARWELCTLPATSPVWVSQEHSRAEVTLHPVDAPSERVPSTSAPWGGAHLAVANWIKWEKSSSWYKCRTDTLKEKQQQSPPLYYGLCGHGSKTTLHSLEFSFERSCIKENNSTTILFKEKMKEEKKIFKLTLGSLFKRAWNYLNYTWKKKKKRKKNMPTRAEKSLQ